MPGAQSETIGHHVRPERHAHVRRLAALPGRRDRLRDHGPVPPGAAGGLAVPDAATEGDALADGGADGDRGRRRATPTPNPDLATGAPGLPIGIDVTRRISIPTLIAKGLAIGLTLDKAATVRVRLTARITEKGRRRTVTLATRANARPAAAPILRLKPTKAAAKLLRARRRHALTATLEVRITTAGAPVRTIRQSVSLRPKK